MEKIKYLDGVDEEFVKHATLVSMGRLFRRWKSDMNRKYVKKQLVPKYMGKITQAQWEEFIKQKTEPEALDISDKFAEILKKNIYPHHLGSSGYVDKVGEWKKKPSVSANLICQKALKKEPSTGYQLDRT